MKTNNKSNNAKSQSWEILVEKETMKQKSTTKGWKSAWKKCIYFLLLIDCISLFLASSDCFEQKKIVAK